MWVGGGASAPVFPPSHGMSGCVVCGSLREHFLGVQNWICPWRTLPPDKDMTAISEIRLACKPLFKKGTGIVIINLSLNSPFN